MSSEDDYIHLLAKDFSLQSPDYSSVVEYDLLSGQQVLIRIVVEYISYVSSSHGHLTDMLESLEALAKIRSNEEDTDKIRNIFQELVSLGQELKVFFTVPNQQILSNISPTPNPNQVVAAFINFLLLMIEVILCFEPDLIACVKGSIENLRIELGFLIAFLGDTAMHLQPTKNILTDIEAVVNEVGSFLYSFFFIIIIEKKETNKAITDIEDVVSAVQNFLHSLEDMPLLNKNAMTDIKALVHEVGGFLDFVIFTGNDQIPKRKILDLALSHLLQKFELLKTKIKEHCITVSKMPSDMAPKTAVVSLFIIDSVLDDLMHLINNKSDRIVGVDDQIVKLHEELMLLGSSVTNIAVQQEAEHEDLVIRTRDVAYEVEYVINSFSHDWYLTLRLPQLIEKIQLISMSMKNNIDAAGMPEVAKYPGEQLSSQSKEPPFLEDIVVGFDNVAIEIVEQLVGETEQLRIISIVGMPGLGKTTLANKLYDHPSVLYHFHKRAWCVVSQTYNKNNVLIDILSSIKNYKRETIMNRDDESLAEDLYKSLKGWRYLIVMDDVWDTKSWDDLKRYFPDDGNGSRILFTTRNKEVGSKASSNSVINELPFLSEAECWELLQRKVFQDENCPEELLDIGKQIATNCHGLPLAVVVIAGVLANIEKKEHLWQKVARNLSSHISRNPVNCIQILELSYKHLPMHLKPCLLYFGALEEDKEIPVRKLIWLWVAEGYIKKEEHKSLEDVALEYVVKLIDRSLLLVSERRFDGGIKTCKIHDLLREMCSRIAEENNFLKVVKFNDDDALRFFSQVSMYQKHHCLSINYGEYPIFSLPFGLHLRSLLCAYLQSPTLVSSSLKVLRVLDIYRGSGFLDGIGIEHLIHLRYLAISDTLPSMESFHKLEYLYVENTRAVEIPDVLLIMVSLRQMYFRGGAYISSSFCWQATKDENFHINSNLHSISVLLIHSEMDLKFLRCLPNLRRLKGRLESSLNYSVNLLNQLESLKLSCWKYSCRILISLPTLKKLALVNVHLSVEQMEIIGGWKYLEVLKLQGIDFQGEQWDTSEGEFPQLKFLKLDEVQIAEWNTSRYHFPRLQRLVLQFCDRLKMIPPSLGDIPTLQMIEVYGCSKAIKESAEQIQEEQQYNGNEELKVIISDY